MDTVLETEYGKGCGEKSLRDWFWKHYQARLDGEWILFETNDGWVRFWMEWL